MFKLSFKVTFGVLAILCFSLFFLGYFIISDLRLQLTQNLVVQGEQLSSFLAKTSVAPIKNYRFYFLQEYALKLEQFSQVAYCEIYNKNGESLVNMESTYTGGATKKHKDLSEEILVVKKSIIDNGVDYGYVEIGLYLKEVKDEIRRKSYRLTWVFLAILIGVAILLRWFLSILLVSPVVSLSQSARQLATGDFTNTYHSRRRDEIGGLINDFNVMRQRLKSSFEEIESKNRAIQLKNDELTAIDIEVMDLNRNLEEKVEERTLKLKQSLQELNDTQNKLVEVQKMASLGRLVSGVAHEINTPIGVCITAVSHAVDETDILRKHFDEEVLSRSELEKYLDLQIESIQMIQDNLKRAANLVKSFKSVSVDQSSSVPAAFSLEDVIESIFDKFRDEYLGIKMELKSGNRCVITSYQDVFSLIVENMLLNSFQHGFEDQENGQVTIEMSVKGANLCLAYSDSGKGMPEEALKNIFEPFYTTKRAVGGTGLGMHIVYNLVTQKLKGDISCKSEEGNGICILISIPNVLPGA